MQLFFSIRWLFCATFSETERERERERLLWRKTR